MIAGHHLTDIDSDGRQDIIVGNDFGANLGLTPTILIADWMRATLDGKPFASEKWYVESSGRIVKTPL